MESNDMLYSLILKRSVQFGYSYHFDRIMAGKIDSSGRFIDLKGNSYFHITKKITTNRILDESYVFTFRLKDLYGFLDTKDDKKIINECKMMLENVSFQQKLNQLYLILDVDNDPFYHTIDPDIPMIFLLFIIGRELKKRINKKKENLIQFPTKK